MKGVLENSLFETQPHKFEHLNELARQFATIYCGNSIVKDNIFAVIENYARKKEIHLEILRFPIHDEELWAMTFLKKGTIFVCVNSELALCKQFFAAAHELYHIYCYVEDADQSYIKNGSMLDSDTANETGKTQEDVEANAFAGLLLMPDQLLSNQIDLFGIDKDDMDTDSVLSLMDMFAIPYKATVLRLYESNCIKRHKAEELFRVTAEDVAKRVELTGKAKRWQLDGSGTESFGTLLEKADYNTEHDYLTESREKEDWKYISELKKSLAWIERRPMKIEKYALLDTDFISKTHFIHGDTEKCLVDLVVEMPGYCFFCHSQIIKELSRHNQQAIGWLQHKISEQKIQCYTDEEILNELVKIRGDFACSTYTLMLKDACDAFSKSYFKEHYQTLENFDVVTSTKQDYLETLQKADDEIGKHNSLGEIKSYVLLQLLSLLKGEQVYVFCSDDKAARNGAISFNNVRCISALSAFLRLKKEISWTFDAAEPYINSYVQFCGEHNQQTFRVMEASVVARMQRVPCKQALEEIFQDRFVELQNGFLKYRDA